MTSQEGSRRNMEKINFVFRLFVADSEPKSRAARENLEQICHQYLEGHCRVETIDVMQDFQIALDNNIFVTPTLLVVSPEPRTTIFGSLSDREKVVEALRLGEGV